MSKLPLLLAATIAFATFAQAEDAKPAARGERREQLTPEQRAQRMKDSLGLNDEQTAKVKAVYEKNQGKFKELRDNTALSQEDRRAKFREAMQAIEQEVAAILTPEQKTKWKAEVEKRRARVPKE